MEVTVGTSYAFDHIASQMPKAVSRMTFYRWRKYLNLLSDSLTPDDLEALRYFGLRRSTGLRYAEAKRLTIEHLKSLEEKP